MALHKVPRDLQEKKGPIRLDMVAYIYNPSYSGGRARRIIDPGQAKVNKSPLGNKPCMWHTSVITASYSGDEGRRIGV
jgi:hypothetical protein